MFQRSDGDDFGDAEVMPLECLDDRGVLKQYIDFILPGANADIIISDLEDFINFAPDPQIENDRRPYSP